MLSIQSSFSRSTGRQLSADVLRQLKPSQLVNPFPERSTRYGVLIQFKLCMAKVARADHGTGGMDSQGSGAAHICWRGCRARRHLFVRFSGGWPLPHSEIVVAARWGTVMICW